MCLATLCARRRRSLNRSTRACGPSSAHLGLFDRRGRRSREPSRLVFSNPARDHRLTRAPLREPHRRLRHRYRHDERQQRRDHRRAEDPHRGHQVRTDHPRPPKNISPATRVLALACREGLDGAQSEKHPFTKKIVVADVLRSSPPRAFRPIRRRQVRRQQPLHRQARRPEQARVHVLRADRRPRDLRQRAAAGGAEVPAVDVGVGGCAGAWRRWRWTSARSRRTDGHREVARQARVHPPAHAGGDREGGGGGQRRAARPAGGYRPRAEPRVAGGGGRVHAPRMRAHQQRRRLQRREGATARTTTRPAGSARGRRRTTWRSRSTSSWTKPR